MTFTLRPAVRENTPLIIGIAGPTKSGKTYSAHRLAAGLANGGPVVMLNAEGKRGHQYAERFKYLACDIDPPYSPTRYEEALAFIKTQKPGAIIIDSASHMHDGPGGLLEWHDAELDRMAGKDDFQKRQRMTWTAWIRPKAAENKFIYTMLGLDVPVVLCFRAKEKLLIVSGKEPVNLGWQPIAGDRITFETLFTVVLPPHSKGVPDLNASELREPFDKMIPTGKPIDEELGRQLAAWAKGSIGGSSGATPAVSARVASSAPADSGQSVQGGDDPQANAQLDLGKSSSPHTPPVDGAGGVSSHEQERALLLEEITAISTKKKIPESERRDAWSTYCGTARKDTVDPVSLHDLLAWVKSR